MKAYFLLFVTLFATQSYAGLFCGDLDCDFEIKEPYDLNQIIGSEEKYYSVQFKTTISKRTYSHKKAVAEEYLQRKQDEYLKLKFYRDIAPLSDDELFNPNKSGKERKKCEASASGKASITSLDNMDLQYVQDVFVVCEVVKYAKKSNAQIQAEYCNQAVLCGQKVQNAEEAEQYQKLIKSMCNGSSDGSHVTKDVFNGERASSQKTPKSSPKKVNSAASRE
ncbi:MAG: hypothetical protein AB7I27_10610 [Bacteriovoracaceae bacterium]